MVIFEPGYLWVHKLQKFRIFIREVYENDDGQTVFLVGKIPKEGESYFERGFDDMIITKRSWTAEDLVREFEPLARKLRPSAWERLMGTDLLSE